MGPKVFLRTLRLAGLVVGCCLATVAWSNGDAASSIAPSAAAPHSVAHAHTTGRQSDDWGGLSWQRRHDADGDGLIEVSSLEQLDAIRHDLNGDGWADEDSKLAAYALAFPEMESGEPCQDCRGYELIVSLDFEDTGSYAAGEVTGEWTSGAGWLPIGTAENPYDAVFEGNGHSISSLFINRVSDGEYSRGVGLFGHVGPGAAIRAIGLFGVNVSGTEAVGSIAGQNLGTVEASYATGSVIGGSRVGGLVGENGRIGQHVGVISSSSSAGRTLGGRDVGGLAGANWGSVEGSNSSGGTSGHHTVGGLIGENQGTVYDGYATGSVSARQDVGGLTGQNWGVVVKSYATGSVSGEQSVGGLAGSNDGVISVGYSVGRVSGRSEVGGSVGTNQGTIGLVFSVGRVEGVSEVGGLVGWNVSPRDGEPATIADSYWDVAVSGRENGVGYGAASGATGATTLELQGTTGYAGVYANWRIDLDNVDGDDDPNTGRDEPWDFGSSNQYPALKADLNGDGAETWQEFGNQPRAIPTWESNGRYDADLDGLIEVSSLEQLAAIIHDSDGNGRPAWDGFPNEFYAAYPVEEGEEVCQVCQGYELTRNLDFKDPDSYASGEVKADWNRGAGWTPLNLTRFAVFDGNGHTISNLYLNNEDEGLYLHRYDTYTGLFALIRETNAIRRVNLADANVTGSYNTGGLVGHSWGEISDSSVTGTVSGEEHVGGLVGWNKGRIIRGHSTATVKGHGAAGGLVGWNEGDSRFPGAVEYSHASGAVSGGLQVGGLVGRNEDGRVRSSYATGDAAGVSGVGGLVGVNTEGFYHGIIIGGYSSGAVSGESVVGGLVGGNAGTIAACYATGRVSGETVVGGLVGDNSMPYVSVYETGGVGTVLASYAVGAVFGDNVAGGLVGKNPGRFMFSFWNTDTAGSIAGAGRGSSAGAVGRNTAELQTPTGFTGMYAPWNIDLDNADGDFTFETGAGRLWDFGTSAEYPALKADVNADGNPTWQEFGSQGRDLSLPRSAATPAPVPATDSEPLALDVDGHDLDGDGLIEITYLEQLNAVRYDLDGDGKSDHSSGARGYAQAFPLSASEEPCKPCRGYELTRSLDFNDPDSYAAGVVKRAWTEGSGWLPIGLYETDPWRGSFNGNGHTLANLYIDRETVLDSPAAVGLFGYTGADSAIVGVELLEVRIHSIESTGSLVGRNLGAIGSIRVGGVVSSTDIAGGMVGWNDGGEVRRGDSTAAVSSGGHAGGLIGLNRGLVAASYATGNVSGNWYVGGLVGSNLGDVNGSYATGDVSGNELVGAFVGYNGGRVSAGYSSGDVSGGVSVGGFTGKNVGVISNCYATGNVSGREYVGGLVGSQQGAGDPPALFNCYGTGSVVGDYIAGGLMGFNNSSVFGAVWDTETSGTQIGIAVNVPRIDWRHSEWWAGHAEFRGGTTAELQEPTGYAGIYQAWREHLGAGVSEDLWDFGAPNQYPALRFDVDGDGIATWQEFGNQHRIARPPAREETPPATQKYDADGNRLIEVATLEQLNAVRFDADANGRPDSEASATHHAAAFPVVDGEVICIDCRGYELTRSLDFHDSDSYASGEVHTDWTTNLGWLPMRWSGSVFEGNGHTISNLYSNRKGLVEAWDDRRGLGLFARNGGHAVIRRIGLVDVDLSGNGNVGGLVGVNEGILELSYVTGIVTGGYQVGGLAGKNDGRGGKGIVHSGYFVGEVTGEGKATGGLVGYNLAGAIAGSYFSGSVSGEENVGGLVGWNESERYDRTFGHHATSRSEDAIVGAAYARGDILGAKSVGGLVGFNSGGTVGASYFSGRVSGDADVGGLVGVNDPIGGAGGEIVDSYWDVETSSHAQAVGAGPAGGARGVPAFELQLPTEYAGIYANWNVNTDWVAEDRALIPGWGDPWDFGTEDQYPALRADFDGDGVSTWREFGGQGRETPLAGSGP